MLLEIPCFTRPKEMGFSIIVIFPTLKMIKLGDKSNVTIFVRTLVEAADLIWAGFHRSLPKIF